MADGTSGPDSFTVPTGNSTFNGFGGVDTLTFSFKLTDATFTWIGNQVVIDTASSHTVVTGFEIFQFTDGTVNNADGSPLVDDLFYYATYHDVWNVKVDPDAHYAEYGWHEKRDPSAFFDTSLYLDANPSARASGINPLTHYANTGWKLYLDPAFTFDTALYLKANPDVAAAGVNPLEHFLVYGAGEGRQPFAANPFVAVNGFDYAYYMANNPDVVAAGVDAFAHFQTFGWKEGRNPNAYFDTQGYLTAYTDVAAAGVNPLDHYNQYGWKEGRIPSPVFDTGAYLAAYPDVANAQVDPLLHFLKYGMQEGRQTFQAPLFDKQSAANTVLEGAAAGTQAGVTASWAWWVSPALTYSIINDTSGGAFTINPSTGVITVADGSLLDFETVTSHSVTVQAQVGGITTTHVFVIAVADAAPTIPPGAPPIVSVDELAANGTTFGLTFHVDDPNGPAATYDLTDSAGGRFTINPTTGEISVANGAAIDYETSIGHAYQVTARGTVGTSSTSQTFTINVNNINEAPTASPQTTTLTIDEDATAALFTAPPAVEDVEGDALTATLTVVNTAAGVLTGGGFTATANPGEYTFSGTAAQLTAALAAVQFDSADDFSGSTDVTVAITDGQNGPLGTNPSWTVAVTVNAVNDAPTASPQSAALTIDEDAAATSLFTVPPTVADVEGDALTATLTLADPAAGVLTGGGFAPTANPGEYTFSGTAAQLTTALAAVQFDSALNFSGSTSVAVDITDGNSGPQGTNPSWTVDITVDEINDEPTLAATANNPAYVPGADLFSSVTASTVEAGQLIDEIVLSATNITGSDETLSIDGVDVPLIDGTSVPTSTAGVTATVSLVGTTATITISSTTGLTAAEVGTLIDGLAYSKTTVGPGELPRTVTIVALHDTGGTANGGDDTGNPNLSSTVNFNIPPTIDVDATLPYTENQAATVIDPTITITDTDDTHMEGAVVKITGGYAGAEDILAFDTALATGFGISGNVVGDTLTFTGNATKADYEQVLESVTYRNSSDNPSTAPRTVSFTVSDGDADSAAGTATINVTAQNDAPQVSTTAGSAAYTENAAAAQIDGSLTLTDVDDTDIESAQVRISAGFQSGDSLNFIDQNGITGSYDAGTGVLTLTGTSSAANYQTALQSITFSSTNDDPGATKTIEFKANDGDADSNLATRNIAITAINDEPTLTATPNGGGTVTFTESGSLGGSNPVDLFSAPIVASAIETGQLLRNLVVTVSNVTDTTEFLVAGTGATGVNLVNGNSESVGLSGGGTATATVAVDGNGVATVTFDNVAGMTAAQINALVDSLQYDNTDDTPTTGTSAHTVTITSLSDDGPGTPSPNDNTAALNISVDVDVVATNDAPVAADVTFKVTGGTFGDDTNAVGNTSLVLNDASDGAPDPDGPQLTFTGDILALATDVDSPQGAITIVPETINDATFGTLIIQADGDFTYLPKAGFTGDAVFTYTVTDNDAVDARTGTGTITIEVVAPKIWYVDATNGSDTTGDGTAANPFQTLTALNGGTGDGTTNDDVDGAGDIIFLYGGTYSGGIVLEQGQQIITKEHGLVVNGNTIEAADSSSVTTINGTVTLASGDSTTFNTIQGVDFGNSSGFALTGSNVGDAKINTVTAGQINNTTGGAISIDTSGAGMNLQFTSVSSNGGTNGIAFSSARGTFNGGSGTLGGASGNTVSITGDGTNDDLAFTYGGNISDDGNLLVNITGQSGGTKTFSGTLTDGAGASGGINVSTNTGTSTVTFTNSVSLNTGTGTGVNFTSNGANVALNFNNSVGGTSGLDIVTTSGNGFNATGGGTVTVLDPAGSPGNSISSGTGIALNVVNTNIGSGGLTFEKIDANGGSSGIVLNNTGTSGGLTVTGDAGSTNNGSGGLIQNTTGAGISLTNTRNVSFDQLNISNTDGSGVNGTGVTNFSYTNSTIADAGDATVPGGQSQHESAIAFNGTNTGVGNNISGTLTVTGMTITNAFYAGITVESDAGTVTSANISNNTITNPGFSGINFNTTGTATTAFSLNDADINSNNITSSGGNGIQISIGNGNASASGAAAQAHAGFVTIDGLGRPVSDPSHIISITNNLITLDSGGTQAITIANTTASSDPSVRTQTNFEILNNGTVANPLTGSSIGTVILIGNNGNSDMAGVVDNNRIDANHSVNMGGGNGIGGGNGVGGADTAWTPRLNLTVSNNVITDTDGNGILLVNRATNGEAYFKINGNNVAAPLTDGTGFADYGIRVDAGNNTAGEDSEVYLNIFNNISAGSDGGTGIGIRKQGTISTTNDFGIYDAAGGSTLNSPPTNAEVDAFIEALNPSGGGVTVISGNNYIRDTTLAPALLAAAGGIASTSGAQGDHDLTSSELSDIVEAAVARWAMAGLTEAQLLALDGLRFDIADLGGSYLGVSLPGVVLVDDDAAGFGWFLDASPFDDAEFGHAVSATHLQTDPSGVAAGQMDLLTVIMHEIGHALGLDHAHDGAGGDLMSDTLVTGERRLPAASDIHAIMQHDAFDFAALTASHAAPTDPGSALFDLLDASTDSAAELLGDAQVVSFDIAPLIYGLNLGEPGHALLTRDGWHL